MNCQEFQDILPHIIESGGNPEEEAHLSTCEACSDLVRDLKYIAEQAKLLLPMRDPSPRVWNNIEQSLQREGLLREGRTSPPGQILKTHPTQKKSTYTGIMMAVLAVISLGILLVNYRPTSTVSGAEFSGAPAATQFDGEDQTLISGMAQQDPGVRQAYEDNLRQINAYIADARKAVHDNPDDPAPRQHLMSAYHQKAMLYNMATLRSMP